MDMNKKFDSKLKKKKISNNLIVNSVIVWCVTNYLLKPINNRKLTVV
jgi:hypothetical protein